MRSEVTAGTAGTVLRTVKQLEYEYEAPVREVVTRLRLIPQRERGAQRVLRGMCRVFPDADYTRRFLDEFGNPVLEYRHSRVDVRLRFEVFLTTAYWGVADPALLTEGRAPRSACGPAPAPDQFLLLTRLVDRSTELMAAADQLRVQGETALERMESVGAWVHRVMTYRRGVTNIHTPASAALAQRLGVCQDYSHVMLAICRLNGIPARYVSGYIAGEGAMHAWVETFLPAAGGEAPRWCGFDPTHDRRANTQYVAVAAGRDYADVSPVTGTYYGRVPGRLSSWCQTVVQSRLA